MRRDAFSQAGLVYIFLYNSSDCPVAHAPAAFIDKYCLFFLYISCAELFKIIAYSTQCPVSYRRKAFFFAFAVNFKHASYKIYILLIQAYQFADAYPAGIKGLKYSPIPEPVYIGNVR